MQSGLTYRNFVTGKCNTLRPKSAYMHGPALHIEWANIRVPTRLHFRPRFM